MYLPNIYNGVRVYASKSVNGSTICDALIDYIKIATEPIGFIKNEISLNQCISRRKYPFVLNFPPYFKNFHYFNPLFVVRKKKKWSVVKEVKKNKYVTDSKTRLWDVNLCSVPI